MRLIDALYTFPPEWKKPLLLVLSILTFVAPAVSLLIMYWNRLITSIKMENRKERIYPFILVTFYYVLAYFYVRAQIPDNAKHPALLSFLFGILVVFVIAFIINFYVKISLHATAIFGLCGMLLAYNQTQLPFELGGGFPNLNIILGLFVIGGMVTAARVYLRAHDLKETLIGMALGFSILFVTVKYSLYL
jgi:hypothetical protein